METNRFRPVMTGIAIIAGWYLIFQAAGGLFGLGPVKPSSGAAEGGIALITGVNNRVSQAMRISLPDITQGFDGTFESPFRVESASGRTASARSRAASAPSRPALALKGVLLKDDALAIIENEKGQTFILGVNDTLSGQKIVSIKADRIVLRDRAGSYDLSVQE